MEKNTLGEFADEIRFQELILVYGLDSVKELFPEDYDKYGSTYEKILTLEEHLEIQKLKSKKEQLF